MPAAPPPLPLPVVKDWPDNDEELLCFGSPPRPENYWSLRDAFEGVQVFGATGSGKSSGSGQAIARAFLEANMGGLVLTAKPDEVGTWTAYAKATGRQDDLLVIGEDTPYRFNFLRYELQRPGWGGRHTENLVNLFYSVMEAADRRGSGGGGGNDSYWRYTLKQLLRSAIDLLVMAADDVHLPAMYRVITSAPKTYDEAASETWRNQSDCYNFIQHAGKQAKTKGRESDFQLTRDYWLMEFPGLAPETRSVIVSSFTSMADCFLRGLLHDLFCTELNFSPEDCFNGKIIVLNLPVKEYHELGILSQVLFKLIWQRAVERRIPPNISDADKQRQIRPVFLWADESQFFANSYDALFQSTARSSRACTVYLTQNLPSYRSAFGSANGGAEVEAFIGNLQTKIFHANGDPATNEWAARCIGRTRQIRASTGMSENLGASGGGSQSAGGSMDVQFLVQPQEFTVLKTGGPEHGFEVGSLIFQGGRIWLADQKGKATGQNYIRHQFTQRY